MTKPNQGVKILRFTWMPGWARSKATTWSWLFSAATIRQVMFRSPVVFGSVPASRACLASLSFPSLQFFHRFWWRFIANIVERLFSEPLKAIMEHWDQSDLLASPHVVQPLVLAKNHNQSVLRCFPFKALQLSPLPPPFIRNTCDVLSSKNRFSIVNQI